MVYPVSEHTLTIPATPRGETTSPSVKQKAPYRIEQRDCLEFLSSLPDESVDIITTDPAYSGMNQHLQLGRGRIVGRYSEAGTSDGKWFQEFHDDPDTYRVFLSECRRVLRDDRHAYIMFDSYSLLTLGPIIREFLDVKNVIVWDKVAIGMEHYFRRRHEHIVFASKGKRKIARRDIPDVWAIRRVHKAAYPTQKPVELFATMLCASAEPGFVVCDPFTGSGSSAIAALEFGCSFIGADIDAKAVVFARDRCAALLEHGADAAQTKNLAEGQLALVLERPAVYGRVANATAKGNPGHHPGLVPASGRAVLMT